MAPTMEIIIQYRDHQTTQSKFDQFWAHHTSLDPVRRVSIIGLNRPKKRSKRLQNMQPSCGDAFLKTAPHASERRRRLVQDQDNSNRKLHGFVKGSPSGVVTDLLLSKISAQSGRIVISSYHYFTSTDPRHDIILLIITYVPNSDILCAKPWRGRRGEDEEERTTLMKSRIGNLRPLGFIRIYQNYPLLLAPIYLANLLTANPGA